MNPAYIAKAILWLSILGATVLAASVIVGKVARKTTGAI